MENKILNDLTSQIATLEDEEAILENLVKQSNDNSEITKLKKDLRTNRIKQTTIRKKLDSYIIFLNSGK